MPQAMGGTSFFLSVWTQLLIEHQSCCFPVAIYAGYKSPSFYINMGVSRAIVFLHLLCYGYTESSFYSTMNRLCDFRIDCKPFLEKHMQRGGIRFLCGIWG